jgi:hypothetical protein
MLTIYAQAAPDARPRPSDRTTATGERLQFIGTRATKAGAHELARRESVRVNGLAIVYSLSIEPRLRATYLRGQLVQEIERPEWRCLYCSAQLAAGTECQQPACIVARAAADRRMGVTRNG